MQLNFEQLFIENIFQNLLNQPKKSVLLQPQKRAGRSPIALSILNTEYQIIKMINKQNNNTKMKREFTKLMAALALLLFIAPLGMWGQTTVTWPGTSALPGTATAVANDQNVTIKTSSTNTYADPIRIYANTTVTINALNGAKILSVAYEASSTGNYVTYAQNATVTPNVTPTVSGKIVTWTYAESDNVTEFTFKPSSQSRSNGISITYKISGGDTPQPTTYTVTYNANGGTGTMTDNNSPYEEDDVVTLLTNEFTAPEGKMWDSWSVKDADDNTITVTDNQFTMPASNVTVTAQWKNDPSAPQYEWVLTNLADLTANDVFVIVGARSNSLYAMSNETSSNCPTAITGIEITGTKLTSTVSDNMKWNIVIVDNGYKFQPNGTNYYLAYSSSTTIHVGNYTSNNVFTYGEVSGNNYLQISNRYVCVATSDWRAYASQNVSSNATNTTFYKRQLVSNDPTINASNLDIAYDATSGSIAYTINNGVDGGTLIAATESNWLTLPNSFDSPIQFTCTANTETAARTATVTLTYTYGDAETVTKDVTVTQAAAPVIYTTIPDLFAASSSTETNVLVTFNDWVVSGVSTNGKNVFVTDNNGNGFVIFDSDGGLDQSYAEGNILAGTAVSCTLKKYNGFAELINVDANDLTITTGGTIAVANVAMADLAGINTGALVHYENLTCGQSGNNYTLTDGTTTIQLYNAIYAFGSLTVGNQYNITGVYQQYNNTKEVLPRDADDIVEVVPSTPYINLETYLIETIASAFDGSYDITYGNLEIQGVDDFTIQFYSDAQGTTAIEHPDWIITNEVTTYQEGYRLHIATSINLGDARTTYLKVSVGNTSSDLVTITQAAPVIDYATLPFSWAGGLPTAFDALSGTTLNGVGSYPNQTTYQMKLDSDNDYIQVKTNSRPGIVTIGVKMIGGGNTSTITVQGSANGQTFTDVETLTISGDQNDELTLTSTQSFGADVRYVRLNFTKGSNVGVGPITIAEYVAPENHDLTVTLSDNVAGIFVFNATNLDDALIENGAAGTVQVLEGTIIQVSPDAAQGYMISSLLINNEDVFSQMVSGSYTFTMTGDVTITATAVEYVEPYHINFFVNGEEFEEAEMAITPGQSLGELPVPSENIPEGFTFVGWMEWPDHPYYNATTAPTMVSSSTVPEDDMILDAVFCISETAQGTYVLSNAAPTDGDWVVLAVNVDGTYYAMNGPDADELTVTNNTIVGTPDAVFEAKKLTQNNTDHIGLKNEDNEYVHLNKSAIKIASGETNGYLDFTQSGTGYLVSTEATVNNDVVTRYIKYNSTEFTVTTDDEEASTLYVFKYVPGATTNKDYTTLVINHTEGLIAEDDNETFYGIHYINDYVIAGNDVTNNGKLVVNNEGTLDMDANTLYNSEAANFVIKDCGQYKGNEVLATMEKTIVGYGNVNNKGGWYLLSSPLGTIDAGDATVTNLMSGPANNYDIYGFDQDAMDDDGLHEWRNYKLIPDGYSKEIKYMGGVLYGNVETMTATFTGTLSNGGNAITLDYTEGFRFSGFNIVGNPLSSDAYLYGKTNYYRLQENAQGESELVETSHTVAIAPMEAVFVQAQGEDEEVWFSKTQPASKHKMVKLQVMHNRGQLVDRACVAFGEGSVLGKFQLNENNTKIYFTQGNKDYAVVRSNGQGEMPVNFKAETRGTYTLNVEAENVEMNYLHLIDNKTGNDVDLLATPSYSFEASNDDYESRFRLVFKANADVEENAATETFAYFNGSEWVINNPSTGSGDNATLQVVDMMGRVLSSETISGNAEVTLNQAAGVYMLRLVNGENVKVQKVVVR